MSHELPYPLLSDVSSTNHQPFQNDNKRHAPPQRTESKPHLSGAIMARVHRLHQILRQLNGVTAEAELQQIVCQQAMHLLEGRGCTFYKYDASSDTLTATAYAGDIKPHLKQLVRYDEGLAGRVLRNPSEAQYIHNYSVLAESDTFYENAASLRAMLAIPLQKEPILLGVLEIVATENNRFNQHDLDFVELFAAQAAMAFENSKLHAAQRQQRHQLHESQAMLVQSEKMAALGRLVASITHEINNPLQSLQSCVALIKEELGDELQAADLDTIADIAEQDISRLAALVQRMRSFYKRPSQQDPPTPDLENDAFDAFYSQSVDDWQAIDIHHLLIDVLQLANKELDRNNVTVGKCWTDKLPLVQGNDSYLKQVFLNLILNASEAMSDSGGRLQIQTSLDEMLPCQSLLDAHNVNVSSAQTTSLNNDFEAATVRVVFEDTGSGIPQEKLSNLFEPLFTTKEKGSGMGLFTSYKIIEAHHGRIEVKSCVGYGSTFTVILPIHQPIPQPLTPPYP